MRQLLFFVYFFLLSLSISSQERTIVTEVIQSKNLDYYGLRSHVEGFVKPSYWTNVPFVDWRFVDSLKYKILDYFEDSVQCDSFAKDTWSSISFHIMIDTLGKVMLADIIVPIKLISCFSVNQIEEFRDFLMGFQFHLLEFRGKVHKLYNRNQINLDSFEFLDLSCSCNYGKKIMWISVDYKLRCQHRAKLPGKWKDLDGNEFEIYKGVDSIPQSIGMLHPLTHQWGRFRYGFGQDQLHVYFGEESTPVDYRWKENHLVLKGKLEGQEFEYILTRVQAEEREARIVRVK